MFQKMTGKNESGSLMRPLGQYFNEQSQNPIFLSISGKLKCWVFSSLCAATIYYYIIYNTSGGFQSNVNHISRDRLNLYSDEKPTKIVIRWICTWVISKNVVEWNVKHNVKYIGSA